jgi:predicted DNA-binding transcriptional regulator AlpA
MNATIEDKYFDIKALSAYSSLSGSTIRNYMADADDPLPSFCIKRKILIKKSEFDRWMERHRTDTKKIDRIVDEMFHDFNTAQ